MRKKEAKQPSKGVGSFSNAMSALSEMCYDYDKLGLNEGANKQVFAGKKPEVAVIKKPSEVLKQPIKTQVVEPQLLNPPKPKTELLRLNPVRLEGRKESEYVTSYSTVKRDYKEPDPPGQQLKVSDIAQNARLEFAYYPQQVKQGGLGDCYLISAISCLAHRDNILNRCIDYLPPELIQKATEFNVRMFESGIYTTVRLDNKFPANALTKQPLYAKPIDGDISVMLLEKAYAKMYGGWQNIHLGHSCDALRDLSGAPTEYIDLQNEEEVREKVKLAFEQDFVLTVSSKVEGIVDKELIRPQHSYSIHAYKLVKLKNGETVFLLKLKNPVGAKFTGNLPQLTQQVLGLLKEPPIQEDGIFWIGFQRLRANFEVVTSCMIHAKYRYAFKTFSDKEVDMKTNSTAFLLQVQENMHGYLSIHQKHNRHFQGGKYRYDVAKIIVGAVRREEGGYTVQETKNGNFGCKQTCTVEVSLSPGDYLVYVQLNNFDAVLNPKQLFTVSLYTSTERYDLSTVALPVKPDALLISYIKTHEKQFIVNRSEKLLRIFGTLFGYVVIYYENLSKKNMVEDIDYDSTNVIVESRKVQLGPGGTRIIKNIIGRDNNCSHKCKINSRTVFSG